MPENLLYFIYLFIFSERLITCFFLFRSLTSIYLSIYLSKSDLTDKMKRSFFQAAIGSILLKRCTTWTLTKRMEKSLTAITQECCEQYWTSPEDNTLQSRSCTATNHPSRKLSKFDEPDMRETAGEEGKSGVLLWTPSHGRAKAGRPARTYIQHALYRYGM